MLINRNSEQLQRWQLIRRVFPLDHSILPVLPSFQYSVFSTFHLRFSFYQDLKHD